MHKGKVFSEVDAPRGVKAEHKSAWAQAQTERNQIVAYDRAEREDRQALIAEELEARALSKLSPKARRAMGMMLRFPVQIRKEILAALEKDGSLKLPFEFVEK